MAYEYVFVFKNQSSENEYNINHSSNNFKTINSNVDPNIRFVENDSSISSVVKSMIVSEATKYAQFATSNVGSFTGSSRTQTRLSNAISGAGIVASFVVNPYLAIANTAYNFTTTIINENHKVNVDKLNTTVSRIKNGYTDTKSILATRRH